MPTIKRAVKKRLFCFMFKLCKCNVPSGVLPSVSLRPGIPECSGRCRHNLLQFPIVSGVPCLLRPVNPAGTDSQRVCSVHQISHHETAVFHICGPVFVCQNNDHRRSSVKRID